MIRDKRKQKDQIDFPLLKVSGVVKVKKISHFFLLDTTRIHMVEEIKPSKLINPFSHALEYVRSFAMVKRGSLMRKKKNIRCFRAIKKYMRGKKPS